MCGLVHVMRKDGRPAYKAVLKRYRKQQSRGTEGYGYVAIKDNKVVSYQRTATEKEIVKLLEKEDAPEIFFHHRNPTGTPNLPELAHPFLVENDLLEYQYIIGHNGSIRNDDELKKKHNEMGIPYRSEMEKCYMSNSSKNVYRLGAQIWNDSEALAVETALVIDGKKKTIDTLGPAAVFGLQLKGVDVINRFFYRNSANPLKYHEDKRMITITSSNYGESVPEGEMWRIKKGGGTEKFGSIKAPDIYQKTNYDDWENKHWNKDTKKYEEIGDVPPWPRLEGPRMGFGQHFPTGDIEFDYEPPNDEGSHRLSEIMGELDEFSSNGTKWSDLVSSMSLDILWAEWDKSVGLKDEVTQKIDDLNKRIEAAITIDEQDLDTRLVLQNQVEKIDDYQADVWDELLERESNVNEKLAK